MVAKFPPPDDLDGKAATVSKYSGKRTGIVGPLRS